MVVGTAHSPEAGTPAYGTRRAKFKYDELVTKGMRALIIGSGADVQATRVLGVTQPTHVGNLQLMHYSKAKANTNK
ncbi:unnamed protein product [Leptosia nina]|uniref:Uncharacterized protein n=1 Tax=Leptosia nina TaxID=320188 RepID=A0AAV1JRM7_9NEOP